MLTINIFEDFDLLDMEAPEKVSKVIDYLNSYETRKADFSDVILNLRHCILGYDGTCPLVDTVLEKQQKLKGAKQLNIYISLFHDERIILRDLFGKSQLLPLNENASLETYRKNIDNLLRRGNISLQIHQYNDPSPGTVFQTYSYNYE